MPSTIDRMDVVLEHVDRYRVVEPLFECVRVVMSYRGESYSPAYIQGISGAAFRIGGICPCAPTCSSAMDTQALIRLLGHEAEHLPLCGEGIDPHARTSAVVVRIKDEIRAGRPALLWHAFTNAEWDVVCGFEDRTRRFFGRGSYVGSDGYAAADQLRAATGVAVAPALGAILIGDKTGSFDPRPAELSALQEAVRHAHSQQDEALLTSDRWIFLEGLQCYDRWVGDFHSPLRTRLAGDAYCLGVYRSTHRAASDFLLGLAPRHPEAKAHLLRASERFAAEADVLDRCDALLGWESPQGPIPQRNARAVELLGRARAHYADGIAEVERALAALS